MLRYAQLMGGVVALVTESETQPDAQHGTWVPCGNAGPGWVYDGATFAAPPPPQAPALPQHSTKRAFQNRFPKLPNGISTKYDAMCMFLTDDGYATSLGVSGAALYDLRMLITTGVQRMNASPFVDMAPTAEAASLTMLLMQGSIPSAFRLSAVERTAMLDTPLADAERYVG